MDYEKKYKQLHKFITDLYPHMSEYCKEKVEGFFPELAESEDEGIRRTLVGWFESYKGVGTIGSETFNGISTDNILAWLEKQKAKEDLDRIAPIYEDKESFESALEKAWKFYNNSGARTVDSCEDNYVECAYAKGFREGFLFGLKRHESILPNVKEEQDRVNPKFKVGDVMRTLQEADGNITSGLPVVVFVGNEYYHCTNELIAIKDQDDYEYPPMNRMQKPTDKVEPKFSICDWIVHDMSDGRKTIRQIIGMTNEHYILNGEGFNTFYFNDIENDYHLWTIDDAKDGDVLVCEDDKMPFIFKGLLDHHYPNCPVAYCGIDNEKEFIVCHGDSWWDNCKIEPSTKEQREFLFAKMKEAGYEWDTDKKELKKNE